MVSRHRHHSSKKARRKKKSWPLVADYKIPALELLEKPSYADLTKKQRKWLDTLYARLFPSPRGRKADRKYDKLFDEREAAKVNEEYPGLFGTTKKKHRNRVPSYTELASRFAGRAVSAKPDDEDPDRQRFIRAYQRRKKAQRLPQPPKR